MYKHGISKRKYDSIHKVYLYISVDIVNPNWKKNIVHQRDECRKYIARYDLNIDNVYVDTTPDNPSELYKCINLLQKGDVIVIYGLKYLTTDTYTFECFCSTLSDRDCNIMFVLENLSSFITEELLMIKMYLLVLKEQQRVLQDDNYKDHVLRHDSSDIPNINLTQMINSHKSSFDSLMTRSSKSNDGYLYIVMSGDRRVACGKTMTDIYNNCVISHYPRRTPLHIYPCKDPDNRKRDLIAWLRQKQYVDYEDRDDTLVEDADIQAVLSKMRELTQRDPLITTMGDLQKQVDKNGSN